MIKREEVAKLAELARLGVSEAELAGVGQDLGKILDYVSDLAKATDNSVATPPLINVWREDEKPYPPGTFRETLLAAAPIKPEAGYFKVKKIL